MSDVSNQDFSELPQKIADCFPGTRPQKWVKALEEVCGHKRLPIDSGYKGDLFEYLVCVLALTAQGASIPFFGHSVSPNDIGALARRINIAVDVESDDFELVAQKLTPIFGSVAKYDAYDLKQQHHLVITRDVSPFLTRVPGKLSDEPPAKQFNQVVRQPLVVQAYFESSWQAWDLADAEFTQAQEEQFIQQLANAKLNKYNNRQPTAKETRSTEFTFEGQKFRQVQKFSSGGDPFPPKLEKSSGDSLDIDSMTRRLPQLLWGMIFRNALGIKFNRVDRIVTAAEKEKKKLPVPIAINALFYGLSVPKGEDITPFPVDRSSLVDMFGIEGDKRKDIYDWAKALRTMFPLQELSNTPDLTGLFKRHREYLMDQAAYLCAVTMALEPRATKFHQVVIQAEKNQSAEPT